MDGGRLAGHHVLLGVSGGIAAYKVASLARALIAEGATVQALLTPAAARFVGPATFAALTGRPAHTDVFEDPERIVHVRAAREADVAVFAPATAATIARFATGTAEDIVSAAYLCCSCPVVVAPAMHTEMWEHPATQENVRLLAQRGVTLVGPDEGELAGGDVGSGRLAAEGELVDAVAAALPGRPGGRGETLAGRRVVVTAGGTREPIDPVRYIANRSRGKMGYALAAEAARRGASVDLVSGPAQLPDPPGVRVERVETALQMRDAVLALAKDADVVVKAAAVTDFRPAFAHEQKVKKDSGVLSSVALVPNPDILSELGASKEGRVLVGFAAETERAEEHGREKLERKGLDLVVVNRVDAADAGFGADTNRALLLGADGSRTELGLMTKTELARQVWERVEALLASRDGDRP